MSFEQTESSSLSRTQKFYPIEIEVSLTSQAVLEMRFLNQRHCKSRLYQLSRGNLRNARTARTQDKSVLLSTRDIHQLGDWGKILHEEIL